MTFVMKFSLRKD